MPLPRPCRAIAAAFLIAACTAAPAAAGTRPDWAGAPGGIIRSGHYDRGQWIYTNGIHQALGANSDGLRRTDYFRAVYPADGDPTLAQRDLYNALTYDFFGAHRGTHNGDYQLPTDSARWPVGTGDLAEVRLRADASNVYVRFLWNSFPRPDAQIATLTFAAGDGGTARPWPRGARLSAPWDAALTVWGGGGAVATGAAGTESPVEVTTGDHTTEARIPRSLLPAGSWTLRGGAGLGDPDAPGSYWEVPAGSADSDSPGSGGPLSPTNGWGLLFAGDDPWTFDELSQSAQLSSATTNATAQVDPKQLESGATTGGDARTGDLSRMFSSSYSKADGIAKEPGVGADIRPPAAFPAAANSDFNVTFHYTGRLQYYGMRVPKAYPSTTGKRPLIVYLHGFTGLPDEAFYNPVGLVDEAERRGYLVATPLGRGDYFYSGEGDLDVLEVIRDVERHYRVDRSRIYLMGHSMGGYGTNNVAAHHPDLFAAVAPAQGTDSIDLHGNLRNVPWFEMSSLQDLDAGAADAKKLYGALSEAGYRAKLLVYTTKIHEYSSIYDTLPMLFDFFEQHRRPANPGVVTWTRPVGQGRPDLGLVYDGAYWLDGVAAAKPDALGTITVESDRIAHARPRPEAAKRTDEEIDTGGPTGRSKGELFTTVPDDGPAARRSMTLRVTARGIAASQVDARRARLGFERSALVVRTDSDGPLTLRLARLRRASGALSIDGRRVKRVRTRSGRLTLKVPAGKHRLVLRRTRR
jgi:predicted esterase